MQSLKNGILFHGNPCVRGHGTLRYAKGHGCTVCVRENSKRRYTVRGEEFRARRKLFYATEEGRRDSRDRRLRAKYGITVADFDAKLMSQNFKCAICETKSNAEKAAFSVDHDHNTGKVRDLLCQKCNAAIGLCDDNPERLEIAAAYLRRHRARA